MLKIIDLGRRKVGRVMWNIDVQGDGWLGVRRGPPNWQEPVARATQLFKFKIREGALLK